MGIPAQGRNDSPLPAKASSGHLWQFEVRTNIRDRVELTFAGVESVPLEFDVWLVEESLSLTQNLRSNPHFSVAGVGEEHPKRLKLLVGSGDFLNDQLPQQENPTDFELSQNFPNPFNPVASIRYGLPHEGRVTLSVFNILGEEVSTLLNDEQQWLCHCRARLRATIWLSGWARSARSACGQRGLSVSDYR